MKNILFLLLVFSTTIFSYYYDPPIDNAQTINDQVAGSLMGFVPNGANGFQDCTVVEDPGNASGIAIDYLAIKPLGLFPAIDDHVSIEKMPRIYWTYGEKHKTSISWETHSGSTSCTNHATFEKFNQTAEIKYEFMGTSKTSTANNINPIELPSEIKNKMYYTDGESKLNVNFTGKAFFTYDLIVYSVSCSNGLCECAINPSASGMRNITIQCNSKLAYFVEGGSVINFLARPVLNEQWYKDNKFDNALMSKRRFYKGEIKLNEDTIGKFSNYIFDIAQDSYGFKKINSIKIQNFSNCSVFESNEIMRPYPLQNKSEAFVYSYEINSSYNGIGWNALSLEVNDMFGKRFTFEEEILSRSLSYNENITEDGKIASKETSRPSSMFIQEEYKVIAIAVGSIGVLLVVIMINRK